jgi:hypothetical protein
LPSGTFVSSHLGNSLAASILVLEHPSGARELVLSILPTSHL